MKNLKFETIVTIFVMLLFTALEFGLHSTDIPILIRTLVSVLIYFIIIYLYYGIARLAYNKHTWLLWGSGIAVYILGYAFSGLDSAWTVLAEWSMILFGGAVIGRLTIKQIEQKHVYTLGMLAVAIFAVAMYAPYLKLLLAAFHDESVKMLEIGNQFLAVSGGSAEETATMLAGMEKTLEFFERILPALIILGAVFQFSIGYLLFVYRTSRTDETVLVQPFIMWKMPYYATPLLLVGALMNFFGNDLIARVGDNLLTFLVVFYSITGLALIEFFLRKLKMHPILRFSVYLLLFLTQYISFFFAVFLGFIDSFKDFRNKQLLSLQKE